MAGEPEFKTVKVPMLDTGIGREAGYESDKALIDEWEKGMASLAQWERDMVKAMMEAETRAFMFGEGA